MELQSLSQFSNSNESKWCNDAKQLLDSVYTLSKKDHQWRRMMLCLHVANNETNNYQTWQPLFDFPKVTIPPINKEPVRKLYRITNVTNKAVSFIKRSNCSKCIKLLNICESGHSSTSKEYPLSNENWTYKYWYE